MDASELARYAKRIMQDLSRLTDSVTEMLAKALDQDVQDESARVNISDEAKRKGERK